MEPNPPPGHQYPYRRVRMMATGDNKRVRCPRCDGAMVFERFQDMLTLFYAWRCVNCGEIVDPVVSKNREPARGSKKKAVGE